MSNDGPFKEEVSLRRGRGSQYFRMLLVGSTSDPMKPAKLVALISIKSGTIFQHLPAWWLNWSYYEPCGVSLLHVIGCNIIKAFSCRDEGGQWLRHTWLTQGSVEQRSMDCMAALSSKDSFPGEWVKSFEVEVEVEVQSPFPTLIVCISQSLVPVKSRTLCFIQTRLFHRNLYNFFSLFSHSS